MPAAMRGRVDEQPANEIVDQADEPDLAAIVLDDPILGLWQVGIPDLGLLIEQFRLLSWKCPWNF